MNTNEIFIAIEAIKKTASAYFKVNHVIFTFEEDYKRKKRVFEACVIARTKQGEIIDITTDPIEIDNYSVRKISSLLRAKCYSIKLSKNSI